MDVGNKLRRILFGTYLYSFVRPIKLQRDLFFWKIRGKPNPPPFLVKKDIISYYARKYSIGTFIETGTYLGDMVYASRSIFSTIISIELDKRLFEISKRRFDDLSNVTIIHGDSSKILPKIVGQLYDQCLFWLDAHYSGGLTAKGELETPVIQELIHILSCENNDHVILIDDAHNFSGNESYPSICDIMTIVNKIDPGYRYRLQDNIICLTKDYA